MKSSDCSRPFTHIYSSGVNPKKGLEVLCEVLGLQIYYQMATQRLMGLIGIAIRDEMLGRGNFYTRTGAKAVIGDWSNYSNTQLSKHGFLSSSRKSTPQCASEISPGRGHDPPPTSPASLTVWCGAR